MIRLVTWNVNGLRACAGKGFMDYFHTMDADVFSVQETKMQPDQLVLQMDGYEQHFNSAVKKGYSGTAVFSRLTPLTIHNGIGDAAYDQEGRAITIEYETFFLVNVYVPNSQRDLARLDYRIAWEDLFRQYVEALDRRKPVIICGDLNVAHQEIDLKNAKSNIGNSGFTDEERGKMTQLLASGFVDAFRYQHPNQTDVYTWWSFMANVRAKNIGWRIDYFLVSARIAENIRKVEIHDQVYGSDHCPVILEIAL